LLYRPGRHVVRASTEDVDLEDQVEAFMKRQAELESGGARPRTRPLGA
jgi:hypothetical protein